MTKKRFFFFSCCNKALLSRLLSLILPVTYIAGGAAQLFGQDGNTYTIVGRVVDEKGRPLSDADICVEPVVDISTQFDSFIECVSTATDGRFSIRKSRNKFSSGREHFLYVSLDSTGPEVMTTITPPFRSLQRYDRSFNGRLIKFGKQSLINVGDVRVQFWHGQASLKFLDYGVGKRNKAIDWSHILLRIRNKYGRVVQFGTLSKEQQQRFIMGSGTVLPISLPEGRWEVEIVDVHTGRVLAKSPYFLTKRNSNRNVVMRL